MSDNTHPPMGGQIEKEKENLLGGRWVVGLGTPKISRLSVRLLEGGNE